VRVNLAFDPKVANESEEFNNFVIFSHLKFKLRTGIVHGSTEFFSKETGLFK
jgi:hypothetical protein